MSQVSVPSLGQNGKAIMSAMTRPKAPVTAASSPVQVPNSKPTTGQLQLSSLYTRAATPPNMAGPDGSVGVTINTKG